MSKIGVSEESRIISRHTLISGGLLMAVVPSLIWIGAIWHQVQANTEAIKTVSEMRLTFDKRLSDRLHLATREMYELKGQMKQLNVRLGLVLDQVSKGK